MRRAAAVAVLGALAVTLGLLAFDLARDEPSYAPGGGDVGVALLGTLAGWAITLAGLLAWRAGRSLGRSSRSPAPPCSWRRARRRRALGPRVPTALVLAYAAPAPIAHAALGPGHRALAAIPYVTASGWPAWRPPRCSIPLPRDAWTAPRTSCWSRRTRLRTAR